MDMDGECRVLIIEMRIMLVVTLQEVFTANSLLLPIHSFIPNIYS